MFMMVEQHQSVVQKEAIQPDRQVNPKLLEVKKVYQYIAIEPQNLEKGQLKIRNKSHLSKTASLCTSPFLAQRRRGAEKWENELRI